MVLKSFTIKYEGKDATVEYEDDLTFGEMESIINSSVDLSDVTKPKVNLPEYRIKVLLSTLKNAPFKTGDLVALRNLKSSVVNQVLGGVLKDYPLSKYLEQWMVSFVGNEDFEIQQSSTTSSPKSSAGRKKR